MSEFIEATCHDGKKVLINTAWIEQVMEDDENGAFIFCAFNLPNAVEQDYVRVKESYVEIKDRIFGVYRVSFDPHGLTGRKGG